MINKLKQLNMSTTTNPIEIRPYNLTELSRIYGVTTHTMKNWLRRHQEAVGEKIGRYYTTLQVKTIFEKLGLPGIAED
jgi:transposase-like protein